MSSLSKCLRPPHMEAGARGHHAFLGGATLATCVIIAFSKPELDEVEVQVGVELERQPRVRVADRQDSRAAWSNDDAQEHRGIRPGLDDLGKDLEAVQLIVRPCE